MYGKRKCPHRSRQAVNAVIYWIHLLCISNYFIYYEKNQITECKFFKTSANSVFVFCSEALNECRQENTIFTALKGEQFMDVDAEAIEYNINAARLQAVDGFSNVDFSFVVPLGGRIHMNEMDVRSASNSLKWMLEHSLTFCVSSSTCLMFIATSSNHRSVEVSLPLCTPIDRSSSMFKSCFK